MRYKVIEYWPTFVERHDEPREAVVESLDEIKNIQWVKKEWKLIPGDMNYYLKNEDGMIAAHITPCG